MVKQSPVESDDDFSPIYIFLPAILFLLLLRGFAFEIVRVEGSSMEPSIAAGSTLLVNRLSYGLNAPFGTRYLTRWREPVAGDIVVLRNPIDGAIVVKRVFAVSGDRITTVNGTVRIGSRDIVMDIDGFDRIQGHSAIPEGAYFVLGDNPRVSVDSRHYGFVKIDDIRGRVVTF